MLRQLDLSEWKSRLLCCNDAPYAYNPKGWKKVCSLYVRDSDLLFDKTYRIVYDGDGQIQL